MAKCCYCSELTRGEKGKITNIVSLLLKHTEMLRLDLHKLEIKKTKKGTHTEKTLSETDNLMIHILPLFYCLASMEIVLQLGCKCASLAFAVYV